MYNRRPYAAVKDHLCIAQTAVVNYMFAASADQRSQDVALHVQENLTD